jgi:hypothetical protein
MYSRVGSESDTPECQNQLRNYLPLREYTITVSCPKASAFQWDMTQEKAVSTFIPCFLLILILSSHMHIGFDIIWYELLPPSLTAPEK